MGLMIEPARADCAAPSAARTSASTSAPAFAAQRINKSLVAQGNKDIAWAWLGTPTARYPHTGLGSPVHAATLHVKTASGQDVVYTLPFHRVFEDLMVRLHDLDGDGRDEMIVIESDALRGSAVVVLGLQFLPAKSGFKATTVITELARSAHTGGTFYWLNPVGVADFDGDGKLDIASVTTPHVGGVLTLYHYVPPKLESFAKAMDTSNHRMGDPEQNLAVIVDLPGTRPTVIVPDMSLKALHALRWEASEKGITGQWKELADVMALPARVQRITPAPGGACVLLADNTWRRVTLAQ
jgi:FG-GAP-like repeat